MEAQINGPFDRERLRQVNPEGQLYAGNDRIKYEIVILIYRVVAMLMGTVLIFFGYLVFTQMVLGAGDVAENVTQLPRIVPALGLATIGLIFCISGIGRLMPLPDIDNEPAGNGRTGSSGSDEQIPVLSPLSEPQSTDKLWYNNVKPLMQKIANNESITSSERQLLRNWLKST